MSAAKHTPGPWYLRTNRHTETDGRPWGWLDTLPPGSSRQSAPSGVQVTWTRGERSEANARLIAAAPDLLEAAEQAHDMSLDGRHEEARELLRAAIARATGDKP